MKATSRANSQAPAKTNNEFIAPMFTMQSMINQMQALMNRDFGNFISSFEFPSMNLPSHALPAMPKVNVTQKDHMVHVEAALPGYTDKEIKVSLDETTLTIEGKHEHEEEKKDEQVHRREFSYGSFRRRLELPGEIDATTIQANFKNGILTVDLPVASQEKPTAKQIPIKNS